uniref:Granulins-like n=1 Tax=Hirondellea gigas TaxID=1518452 RepID=A0A2P2I181_9CRUS
MLSTSSAMLLLLSVVALPLTSITAKKILCPDNQMKCLDTNTCCILPGGQSYGCCPFANGVCCADRIHCCPNGKSCDEKNGRCSNSASGGRSLLVLMFLRMMQVADDQMPMMPLATGTITNKGNAAKQQLKKSATLSEESALYSVVSDALKNGTTIEMVPCPDHSVCPGQQTCCPFVDGSYGCCPFSRGVCCSDHQSCCPHKTICVNDNTCI